MTLIDELKSLSSEYAKHYPIHYIVLYGSYARGDYKPYSDIDIAIKFEYGLRYEDYLHYSGRISNEFSERLGKEVNVIPINIADTILKYEIFSHDIIIYYKDIMEYYDDKLNAIDEYLDFKEVFDRHYKGVREEIRRD